MKRILSIAFFVTALAVCSQAQEKKETNQSKPKDRKEWNKKSRENLDLTEDQEKQLKQINSEFRTQATAIKENKSLSDVHRKEQLKALHEKRKEKFKSILTPEQQQKVVQQRRPQRKRHNRETTTK